MNNVFNTKRDYDTTTEAARKCGPVQYILGIRRTQQRLPMRTLGGYACTHLLKRLRAAYPDHLKWHELPHAARDRVHPHTAMFIFEPPAVFFADILDAMPDTPAEPGDLEGMQ